MKTSYTTLVAPLIGCCLLSTTVQAQSMPEFRFSGFGTLAATRSNNANSDFVGTQFQPNGVGHTRSISLNPDSKLGGQLGVVFNDKFSAVVQLVAQHQYDNSFEPQLEWANVKYQVSPEFSVRLGRIASPSYLLSESRFVGYSNPWVRPPTEVYNVLSITSNDGIDATWRSRIAGANNALQVYYGGSTVKLSSAKATSKPSWGINDTVEIGALTLRAGYNSLKVDLQVDALAPLFGGMEQMGMTAMLDKYKLDDMATSALALGATYDPGSWFLTAEVVVYKGSGILSNSRSWYISGGYRLGSLTPYVTYSATRASIEAETGAGPLNAGINATLHASSATQHTNSVGLRWDFMKNVALKAQYDHIVTGDQSNGYLRAFPGFVQGSRVNVVTVAADFVF